MAVMINAGTLWKILLCMFNDLDKQFSDDFFV